MSAGPSLDPVDTVASLLAAHAAKMTPSQRVAARRKLSAIAAGPAPKDRQCRGQLVAAARQMVEALVFYLSGGDDPRDKCSGCGLPGVGEVRNSLKALRLALEGLEEKS